MFRRGFNSTNQGITTAIGTNPSALKLLDSSCLPVLAVHSIRGARDICESELLPGSQAQELPRSAESCFLFVQSKGGEL